MIFFFLIFSAFAHDSTPPELRDLREQARLVMLKTQCAGCHTPGSGSTKQRALKIYNLSLHDWSSTMNDRQFGRLVAATDLEPDGFRGARDPHTDFPKKPLAKKDSDLLLKYIARESKFRNANPKARFDDKFRIENPTLSAMLPKSCTPDPKIAR